jgi:hypothetical protein
MCVIARNPDDLDTLLWQGGRLEELASAGQTFFAGIEPVSALSNRVSAIKIRISKICDQRLLLKNESMRAKTARVSIKETT